MSDISEKGSDFLRDLGNAARKNPLSAALIGMGVFWLFTGSRPVERAADFVRRTGFDRIPDAAGNAFEAARSTFRSGAGSIGEHVTSAKDALRDDGADALDSATRFGRDYSDAASDYAQSYSWCRGRDVRHGPLQLDRANQDPAIGVGRDRARDRRGHCSRPAFE